MDLNIPGWKSFGAEEYGESMTVAEEEAAVVFESHDHNRDGKLDLNEFMYETKADL